MNKRPLLTVTLIGVAALGVLWLGALGQVPQTMPASALADPAPMSNASSGASSGPSSGASSGVSRAMIERGDYLVKIMACNDCHTPWQMKITIQYDPEIVDFLPPVIEGPLMLGACGNTFKVDVGPEAATPIESTTWGRIKSQFD
jgi:hypothetical protein